MMRTVWENIMTILQAFFLFLCFLWALWLFHSLGFLVDSWGIFSFLTLIIDLVTNLLASLLVVIVIDRVINRWKMQKTERSRNYVRRRIAGSLTDLIWSMMPPQDWKTKLEEGVTTWNDYIDRVWSVKSDALQTLETMLHRHSYLIDLELVDGIFNIVEMLSSDIDWIDADPRMRNEFKSPLSLYHIASVVQNITSLSYEILFQPKKNLMGIVEYRVTRTPAGKAPITEWKRRSNEMKKRDVRVLGEAIQEYQRFKDACHKTIFEKEEKHQ